MSAPFPNTSLGPRDAYNYYHSQVRINIECVFGVLTTIWRLLKFPVSAQISINRINALISCLCKIHNFCIDNGNSKPPQRDEHDRLTLMDVVNNPENDEDPHPLGLLGGSEHFSDIPEGRHGANWRSQRLAIQQDSNTRIPQNNIIQHVIARDIHCPRPFDT